MSIDGIIERVEKDGADLILHLGKRVDYQPVGAETLVIKEFTHIPEVGLDIWGGSNSVIIENPETVEGRKKYKRVLGDLIEDF
jgi:hypothetical protein